MEIISPNKDFGFNSSRSPPYPSATSAPKGFGDYYFSAPPSPAHLPELCRDFDDFYVEDTKRCSEFLMEWGGKPISPNFKRERTIFNDDFAFDVRGEFERMTLPAEELFDGGKIRPLQPHTNLGPENREGISHDSKSSHDLTASAHEGTEPERGRGRKLSSLPSNRSRRARSVSPYRISKYPWEEEEEEEERPKKNTKQSAGTRKAELTSTSSSLSSTSKNGNKKWRLKDLFLFRSASEGRATDKAPLIKRTALFKRNDEAKKSSFRSIEAGSNSNRRGPVSAHEKHYTKNRAVSEDLKKKTFLPYKQGILGRLSFNPAVHALSNGFGFSRK